MEWSIADRKLLVRELTRTTEELYNEVWHLAEEQYQFRENDSLWSIKDILEHLEMQNQLHFRELRVVMNSPEMSEYTVITRGQDQYFTKYSTDTTKSKAQWFMEPRNRYSTIQDGWNAFHIARKELLLLVASTELDLRQHFTFRVPTSRIAVEDLKIGQVRDLHQLVLTGIAHTDRHIAQIKKIKEHPDYPTEAKVTSLPPQSQKD
nr:DinB family protein [Allomuricauda sp.]